MTALTDRSLILWLQPDWTQPDAWVPALAAYVNAVPADADTCLALCVDGRDGTPHAAVVGEAVSVACDLLAEGRAFADVVLVEGPATRPPRAVGADTPEAVLAATGAVTPVLPDDTEGLVDDARWGKTVMDAVRAVIDRWAFSVAPAPSLVGEPLVTVRIATYGSTDDLLRHALPSVLNGRWTNVEVLVCSDGPQPHARAAVEQVRDPRVRYLELPARPVYAQTPYHFWQTAGAGAVNHVLDHAKGDWIAPLDHDDAFSLDHITLLLAAAKHHGADFVYGQAMMEHRLGGWWTVGSEPLQHGGVAHGAVMYSRRLAHMRHDADAWLIGDPGDWNMWRRIQATGARIAHVPRPVLMHFRERTMIEDDPDVDENELHGVMETTAEDVARDVRATAARRYLAIARRSQVARAQAR